MIISSGWFLSVKVNANVKAKAKAKSKPRAKTKAKPKVKVNFRWPFSSVGHLCYAGAVSQQWQLLGKVRWIDTETGFGRFFSLSLFF